MVVGLKIVALISSAEQLCVQHAIAPLQKLALLHFSPWAFFLALGSLRSVYFSLLALFLLSVICLFTASRVKLSCPRGDSSNSLMQKCLQESFFQFSHSECHILTLAASKVIHPKYQKHLKKKLLNKYIWGDKNGLVFGRLACISSKNLKYNK